MFSANFTFVISHSKIHPALHLNTSFESSNVVLVKKNGLLKVYYLSLFLYVTTRVKKIKLYQSA